MNPSEQQAGLFLGLFAPPAEEERAEARERRVDQVRAAATRAQRIANKLAQPTFLAKLDGEEAGEGEAEPLELPPIQFDDFGACTQHQSPCARFLCPRNLMFDFGEPYVDAAGHRLATVTLNTGIEAGRRGRRASWTPEDQADEANWRALSNQALDRFDAMIADRTELCVSHIARGIQAIAKELEEEELTIEEKLVRRRQLDELTVVQLAEKMGVSDETLRLLTVSSFRKIRAAAEEGGRARGDGLFESIEAILFGAG